MSVQIRYFASLREALGSGESADLNEGETLLSLRQRLMSRSPEHAEALSAKRLLRCALNQVMCDELTAVPDGVEVAFFPPVTGG